MKKYTTDRKGTTMAFSAIAVFCGIVFYWNRNPSMTYSQIIIGLLGWFVFVGIGILIMTVFTYVTISGTTLKFVWLLFSRRRIDINSITDINDQPIYKAAKGQFRSLYIFYKDKNNETKWIELRITIFPEKTLGRLIKDLKKINIHIQLNKYAEKLMQAAA